MAKQYGEITPKLQTFIAQQHLFFVGTAAADGRVNVSPKGMDTLRVLSPQRVVWLNLTGSGNETAAHLLENPRMTLMFCALAGDPLILRLYGQAKTFHPRDPEWIALSALFEPLPGARQVIDMQIDLVQTSCGMAVPYYDFQSEREQLRNWAIDKGEAGLNTYWQQKNQVSIDGKPTQIFAD